MIRTCSECGNAFKTYDSWTKRGHNCCSKKCSKAARAAERRTYICDGCGKEFVRTVAQAKRSKRHFCSQQCYKEHKPPLRHGTGFAYTRGCRCRLCTEAHRLRHRAWVQKPHDSIPHGTGNGYRNYQCRCKKCRAAGALDNQKQRELAAQRNGLPPPKRSDPNAREHGKINRYANLGCRCERCREAARVYRREKRLYG